MTGRACRWPYSGPGWRIRCIPVAHPVGQEVRPFFAGGRITLGFPVVGVLEEQGGAGEADDQGFVPLSATAGRLRILYTPTGELRVTEIDVQSAPGAEGERVKGDISELLLFRHDMAEPDFVLQSQDDLIDAATELSNTLSILWAPSPESRWWSVGSG